MLSMDGVMKLLGLLSLANPNDNKPESVDRPANQCESYRSKNMFLTSPDDYSRDEMLKGSYPDHIRKCYGEFYRLGNIENFQIYVGEDTNVDLDDLKPADNIDDILIYPNAFYLFDWYYDLMLDPPAGLAFLINEIRSRTEHKKIDFYLPNKPTLEMGGLFYQRHNFVSVMDTFNVPSKGVIDPNDIESFSKASRSIDHNSLYHELGHYLMKLLYKGKFPDYEGHWGHDKNIKEAYESCTNMGAAWAEGFANAVAELDGASPITVDSMDFYRKEWFDRSFEDKLSNEFLIKTIILDFIRLCEYKDGICHVKRDLEKLGKIISCMEKTGLQSDFREFIYDYIRMFPEDKELWFKLIREYYLAPPERIKDGDITGDLEEIFEPPLWEGDTFD